MIYTSNSQEFRYKPSAFIEKYRPLVYTEITENKPFITKIPNSKYVFKSYLQSFSNVIRFHQMTVNTILKVEETLADTANRKKTQKEYNSDSVLLLQYTLFLASVMWEFAVKPKNIFKRFFMKRAFLKAFMEDVTWGFELVKTYKDFNQRFFFTIKSLKDYPLWQNQAWRSTESPNISEDLTRIRKRSLAFSPYEKLRKQAESASMN